MPTPPNPPVIVTPADVAQGSVTTDSARARFVAFAGAAGEALLVSASNPLPTDGGGGGGGSTVIQYDVGGTPTDVSAGTPLPVTLADNEVTVGNTVTVEFDDVPTVRLYRGTGGATVTLFTSITDLQMLAADPDRVGVLIYNVASSTGTLLISWASPATTLLYSYAILPGGAYSIPPENAPLALNALFTGGAGNAMVTEFT
jgi:hypothetical protein